MKKQLFIFFYFFLTVLIISSEPISQSYHYLDSKITLLRYPGVTETEATNTMCEEINTFHIHDESNPVQDEPVDCGAKAKEIMLKMGYKDGTGLGKNAQGITKIVDIPYQQNTRGLGMKLEKFGSSMVSWDFSKEAVDIKEHVTWLTNWEETDFSYVEMQSWTREGTRKSDIIDEVHFCDQEILHKVLEAKGIFDEMDEKELYRARSKSNPFEAIKSVFFMNRASLKIANIDAATDFMFSKIDENEYHKDHEGPYYFADVCAGPGGFTEYILWRKKWLFKGFGLTLRDEHDFKLFESCCASPVTFQALYGKDGDGNVCSPDNILDFRNKVLHETGGEGVHFMMSDGGFSVEGKENLQEVLSKNIYVLSIIKPNTSRPANSERYLICSNLKDGVLVQNIKKHLWDIVKRLWNLRANQKTDVLEIVPIDNLKRDEQFYKFICDTNNRLGSKQIVALEKLAAFCRNPTLIDVRQKEFRSKSLEYWQIPDQPKMSKLQLDVDSLLNSVTEKSEMFYVQPTEVNDIRNFKQKIPNAEDWHYCCLFSSEKNRKANIYAAVGNSKSYQLHEGRWVNAKNVKLCQGTLLFGESVKERCTTDIEEKEKPSLHVIDALQLGDRYLGELSYSERLKLIKVYCAAVNRESQRNYVRIRPKPVQKLKNIASDETISFCTNGEIYSKLPLLGFNSVSEVYDVNSVLILKTNCDQTFYSTYEHRVQILLKHADETNDDNSRIRLSFEEIVSEIEGAKV